MKISRRKQGIPSMDIRKIREELVISIIQDKRIFNNLSLSEKVKLKRFVKFVDDSK